MTSQVRRITVSLPREQIKSIKSVSKMLNRSVSGLVSELIGEAVVSFEQLVVHNDFEGAKRRIDSLNLEALETLEGVKNARSQ